MTKKDAAFFPLVASAALFGLYIFFKVMNLSSREPTKFLCRTSKLSMILYFFLTSTLFVFQIFSKEYVNLLLTGYFFILGVITLAHLARYCNFIFTFISIFLLDFLEKEC